MSLCLPLPTSFRFMRTYSAPSTTSPLLSTFWWCFPRCFSRWWNSPSFLSSCLSWMPSTVFSLYSSVELLRGLSALLLNQVLIMKLNLKTSMEPASVIITPYLEIFIYLLQLSYFTTIVDPNEDHIAFEPAEFYHVPEVICSVLPPFSVWFRQQFGPPTFVYSHPNSDNSIFPYIVSLPTFYRHYIHPWSKLLAVVQPFCPDRATICGWAQTNRPPFRHPWPRNTWRSCQFCRAASCYRGLGRDFQC